jgi:hypothetical protein
VRKLWGGIAVDAAGLPKGISKIRALRFQEIAGNGLGVLGGRAEEISRQILYRPAISSYRIDLSHHDRRSCARGQNKKGRSDCSDRPLRFNPGGDLRSRAVSSAVSSARQGLTSVFGMGTGVTLAVRPPGNWKSKSPVQNRRVNFDEQLNEVGFKPSIPLESSALQKSAFRSVVLPFRVPASRNSSG